MNLWELRRRERNQSVKETHKQKPALRGKPLNTERLVLGRIHLLKQFQKRKFS